MIKIVALPPRYKCDSCGAQDSSLYHHITFGERLITICVRCLNFLHTDLTNYFAK